MLILTRRLNESIIINNDIEVAILGIKGSQIRLGINAPASMPVHRKEIQERIRSEKQLNKDDNDDGI